VASAISAPTASANDLDLVLVDWSARQPDWTDSLWERTATRVILFGPHTDLEAHATARDTGFGPMWARSKLIRGLAAILRPTT